MTLNQKLIIQLRLGVISVENDGTLEQLRKVIKKAFKDDDVPAGSHRFYYAWEDIWSCDNFSELPSVSVKDFFEPSPITNKY